MSEGQGRERDARMVDDLGHQISGLSWVCPPLDAVPSPGVHPQGPCSFCDR